MAEALSNEELGAFIHEGCGLKRGETLVLKTKEGMAQAEFDRVLEVLQDLERSTGVHFVLLGNGIQVDHTERGA